MPRPFIRNHATRVFQGPVMLVLLSAWLATAPPSSAVLFTGAILDAITGKPIPARVYVQAGNGEWLFVESASPDGSAFPYKEQWVPMADSIERHTTISAHPFRIELQPGRYDITIERGKEFHPLTRTVVIADANRRESFRLNRWINLAERGWYSGETHVHRRVQELPNVMLAEDLNVAFPVTFWTTQAYAAPDLAPSTLRRQGPSPFGPRKDLGTAPILIDDTHVMFPRNTEYEVFTVDGRRHTQGAVFILNHKTTFQQGMPPVGEIAAQAHREGALLDLDKHNWPWSMMLVPIARIDLYELSNNSVWRAPFGFRGTSTRPADYMKLEKRDNGFTEWGWLNFGFENYYALLNCGFRLTPTAGTASGVHPVPLGHSRVYVHLDGPFDGDAWIEGLRRGRSFVTTGPMLFAKVNGQHAGHVFEQADGTTNEYSIELLSLSDRPISRIEVIVNGAVERTIKAQNEKTPEGAFATQCEVTAPVAETSWIAVRSIQSMDDGRNRFAHTAPWHIEVGAAPIRPRKEEIQFLIRRVEDEIARNASVLSVAAMAEFHEALRIYQDIARRSR